MMQSEEEAEEEEEEEGNERRMENGIWLLGVWFRNKLSMSDSERGMREKPQAKTATTFSIFFIFRSLTNFSPLLPISR